MGHCAAVLVRKQPKIFKNFQTKEKIDSLKQMQIAKNTKGLLSDPTARLVLVAALVHGVPARNTTRLRSTVRLEATDIIAAVPTRTQIRRKVEAWLEFAAD